MEQEISENNGPIGASAKIYKELVNTSMIKKLIDLFLSELDPEHIPDLVHAMIWEDPNFFLQMVGTSSAFVNILIQVMCEIIRNVSQFQAEVLTDTISNMAKQIDVSAIGEGAGLSQMLLTDIMMLSASHPEMAEAANNIRKGIVRGYLEAFSSRGADAEQYTVELFRLSIKMSSSIVSSLVRYVSELQAPELVETMSGIVDQLDVTTIGESFGLSQMLMTDMIKLSDSNPEIAKTAGKIGKGLLQGYLNSFSARGADAEQYATEFVRFSMKMTSSIVSYLNTEMQKPDSIVRKMMNDMVANVGNLVRENPVFMREMLALVISMGQSIFPGGGARQ